MSANNVATSSNNTRASNNSAPAASANNNRAANNNKPAAAANNNRAANNNKPAASANNNRANNSNNNRANNNNNRANNSNNSISGKAKGTLSSLQEKFNDPSNKTMKQVIIFVLVVVLTLLVLFLLKKFFLMIRDRMNAKPWLVKGSKNAKKSLVIAQNPKDDNAVTLYRSDDRDGLEFGYTFWMCLQDMQYNYGKWKHVFHKGNKSSYPNRSPGVWIHPERNALRIYMNTYKSILNFVDVENIPVQKWIHVGIVVSGTNMDVYINGKLRKRTTFDSVPKQNFGDVWITMNGGFEGYLSRLQYFRYALDYKEMYVVIPEKCHLI